MDLPFALTQARALDAVVRHGSFSRAAAELGLTQPAVSMQVRQLETALGLPLVERMGKRAFATRAGELLLEHSARAVRELETAVQMLQRLRGRVAGRIRIGTSASLSIYVLPPVFRSFRARHPDVELIVVTGNAPEIAHAIVANHLDIGITSLPVRERELTVLPFCEDEQVAIAPRRAPWPPRPRPTAAELAEHPLIPFERRGTVPRVLDDWFPRARVAPPGVMELGNTEAIKKLVGAGLGLSIVSHFTVDGEARAGSGGVGALSLDPPLIHQRGIILRRDKPRTPALDALLAALREVRFAPRRRSARAGRVHARSATNTAPSSSPTPPSAPRRNNRRRTSR